MPVRPIHTSHTRGRYSARPTNPPPAAARTKPSQMEEYGGCVLPGSALGVHCPTGCELRNELIKQRPMPQRRLNSILHNITSLKSNFNSLTVNSDNIVRSMQNLRSRMQERSGPQKSAQDAIEARFKELRVHIESTVPNTLRIMKELLMQVRAKIKRLDESLQTQTEYCAMPCVISCNIPVVSGAHCEDVFRNGGYTSEAYYIQPDQKQKPYKVFCDMQHSGGGWTIIQNRVDGSTSFARNWDTYKNGFGNVAFDNGKYICNVPGEYWIGTERILELSQLHEHVLLFDMKDWKGEKAYAQYNSFRIDGEDQNYRFWIDQYTGNAGDALIQGASQLQGENRTMTIHNGMEFSTFDRDNDGWLPGNPQKQCAKEDDGGWWYNRCHSANPNGRYYWGGVYTKQQTDLGTDDGVVWMNWKGSWYSLREMSMKMRPRMP
uniref:Fibrinogen beta chain n=1 Tax=Eptatretus burgeri TaxID=7764 RepID=A0A8C4RD61_EPTBU